MRALSLNEIPLLLGVKLSTYDVSKLPAPQTTRPTKTTALELMKVFCAQKAVMQDAWLDAPVSLINPFRPLPRRKTATKQKKPKKTVMHSACVPELSISR